MNKILRKKKIKKKHIRNDQNCEKIIKKTKYSKFDKKKY